MARPSLPPCPCCGTKLPYDRKPIHLLDGAMERFRLCSKCGYFRTERTYTTYQEVFPKASLEALAKSAAKAKIESATTTETEEHTDRYNSLYVTSKASLTNADSRIYS